MEIRALDRIQAELTDEQVVERVLAGETELFEVLMRRHNQRVYRAARAILRQEHEAEDVMQEAYVRAYQHLGQFAGRASFSTWLLRIAVNEALLRLARRRRFQDLDLPQQPAGDAMNSIATTDPDPERLYCTSEAGRLLENAIDALPEMYRTVFMLRDVEELNTQDTAHVLEITEENVKTRLHRARALLRRELYARTGAASGAAFLFQAARWDRVGSRGMDRMAGTAGS